MKRKRFLRNTTHWALEQKQRYFWKALKREELSDRGDFYLEKYPIDSFSILSSYSHVNNNFTLNSPSTRLARCRHSNEISSTLSSFSIHSTYIFLKLTLDSLFSPFSALLSVYNIFLWNAAPGDILKWFSGRDKISTRKVFLHRGSKEKSGEKRVRLVAHTAEGACEIQY